MFLQSINRQCRPEGNIDTIIPLKDALINLNLHKSSLRDQILSILDVISPIHLLLCSFYVDCIAFKICHIPRKGIILEIQKW